MTRRLIVLAVAVALGVVACTRTVVLDPAPDGGSGFQPDAAHGGDGGNDGGVMDAGVIGDAFVGD